MAEVLPFRGIRYSTKFANDLDNIVTPPYDVIDPSLQDALYDRHPYNMVRLDFGRIFPEDNDNDNRYSRAAKLFGQWLDEGVLTRDDEPSIYYTEESYTGVSGEQIVRKGFLAAVRIEDPDSGLYHPHEKTLAGPKADRLKLTTACRANFSPIFGLYDDPEGLALQGIEKSAAAAPASVSARADDGTGTKLWQISDPELISRIAAVMAPKGFFIADGHHRYETALAYRDLMREKNPDYTGKEPWNYVLMYLCNMWAPGLSVFPTHRAVFGLDNFNADSFLTKLSELFDIEEAPGKEALFESLKKRVNSFGLVLKGDEKLKIATLKDPEKGKEILSAKVPEVLQTLDVTILHALILEEILGISEKAQEDQLNLTYVKNRDELVETVRGDNGYQLGFLLNPTKIEEVKAVAEKGLRMPQKSTFFYPKILTGLVINPLYV